MEEAIRVARQPLNHHLKTLVAAAADWTEGLNSKDYPNYDKRIGGLSKETFETQVEKGAAWVGTPETIAKQIRDYQQMVGGFEIASMQLISVRSPSRTPSAPCAYSPKRSFRQRSRTSSVLSLKYVYKIE